MFKPIFYQFLTKFVSPILMSAQYYDDTAQYKKINIHEQQLDLWGYPIDDS